MTFDFCIMNPPFSGSTHLKFLEKTIKVADKVISIQPISWLENPLARYNKNSLQAKYEYSISKHIKDLDVISAPDAKKHFDAMPQDCAIYVCDGEGGYDYKQLSSNDVIDKVIDYIHCNKCNLEMNKKDGYRMRIPVVTSGRAIGSGARPPYLTGLPVKDIVFEDGKHDGKWWHEHYVKNQHSKTTEEITCSIKFDTIDEGHNFFKSTQTEFVRYVENQLVTSTSINNSNILWMGNATHPTTGTVGYVDEWTNEDFYIFFDITQEQQQYIEQFIHNADKQINDWFINHKNK